MKVLKLKSITQISQLAQMTAVDMTFHLLKIGVKKLSDSQVKIWLRLKTLWLNVYSRSLWLFSTSLWIFSTKPKYNTIQNCPILIWDKIKNEKDLVYLFDGRNKPLNVYEMRRTHKIYERMLDDLMKEFEPKEYLQMIKDEIAIELLRWKSYNGGGKMLRTIANIKESELNVKKEAIKDKMLNSEVKSNLVAIQKSGIQLPPFYQISVFDYYTYLNYGK